MPLGSLGSLHPDPVPGPQPGMVERKKPREYRGNSCLRCHKQKVKCSRNTPCRNCHAANKPCVYAVRDRKVTVAESYIKRLETAASAASAAATANPLPGPLAGKEISPAAVDPGREPVRAHNSLVENATAERFVSKLKEIHKPRYVPGGIVGTEVAWPSAGNDVKQPPTYEYFALNSDTSHAKCTFNLPPYPYAIHLMNQFLIYIAHDWHWFRLRQFRHRLENLYKTANSAESKDRIWLCQLLVAFALGSSISGQDAQSVFHRAAAPSVDSNLSTTSPATSSGSPLATHSAQSSTILPALVFFEQAMGLLKIPYEEVSVEHIETLNLVALCSYSLNRRKTAYMYSGQSARMCNLLHLHDPDASVDCSPAERENRKRVWWSTFCIDRMASTQMGILPTLQISQADLLSYPTMNGLAAEDLEEFTDPAYLTARIQLTIIQADSVSEFGGSSDDDDAKNIASVLLPRLKKLQAWRAALPPHISVDFNKAMAMLLGNGDHSHNMPELRSLGNLYLRYNQCVILLLRPLLLRQISCIFTNEESNARQNDLRCLNNACLDAARSSLTILIDLRACGLLARFGFMENMHLFSSLMILCLAKAINARRLHSFRFAQPDDDLTYEAGKEVLRDMKQAGSLAARGHEGMLDDVEALGSSIMLVDTSGGSSSSGEGAEGIPAEHWDLEEWMAQLFESGESLADLF